MEDEVKPDLSGLSARYREGRALYEETVARALSTFAYQESEMAWLRLDQGGLRYSDKALNDSEMGRAVSEAWAIRAQAKGTLDAAAAGAEVQPKTPKAPTAHGILVRSNGLRIVAGLTYAVGEARLAEVEENGIGALRVNTYNPSTLVPAEAETMRGTVGNFVCVRHDGKEGAPPWPAANRLGSLMRRWTSCYLGRRPAPPSTRAACWTN